MDILSTASVGLCFEKGKYWMQTIFANTDQGYFTEISEEDANLISRCENIEIAFDVDTN